VGDVEPVRLVVEEKRLGDVEPVHRAWRCVGEVRLNRCAAITVLSPSPTPCATSVSLRATTGDPPHPPPVTCFFLITSAEFASAYVGLILIGAPCDIGLVAAESASSGSTGDGRQDNPGASVGSKASLHNISLGHRDPT
jgi:hypothetical protein